MCPRLLFKEGTANVAAMMRFIQAALLIIAIISSAHAQQAPENNDQWHAREAQHYKGCMAQTRTAPEAAFDDAVTWQGLGGGAPASHCRAAALMGIGHYVEAAQGLEHLAQDIKAQDDFKVRLYVQSAQAWVAADNPDKARRVADTALTLRPNDPDALIARAQAFAALSQFWDAADDLNTVLSADPAHVEALVMRGSAYRKLNVLDLALEDLNRALALQPSHAKGLFERAATFRLQGQKTAARADWRKLIQAQPKSELGLKAAADLHSMDSGVDLKTGGAQ